MTIKKVFEGLNRQPFQFQEPVEKEVTTVERKMTTADIHTLHAYQHKLQIREAIGNVLSSEIGHIALYLLMVAPIVILGL